MGLMRHVGGWPVHLLVPRDRRVVAQPGLCIRLSQAAASRSATVSPPRVTAAHAVLDLVNGSPGFDAALARVADCCQTRRVTLQAVASALSSRRVKWGSRLAEALHDTLIGSDSILEVRYVRDVEIAHELPSSNRQRRCESDVADCSYDEQGVLVELDGRLHLISQRRWRDMHKDNRSALRGDLTLHYGYIDVSERPCAVALQVAEALWARGYVGAIRPCRRAGCAVGVRREPMTADSGSRRTFSAQ